MMRQYYQQQQPTTRNGNKQFVSLWILVVVVLVMASLQVMINLLLYSNLNHLSNDVALESFRNEVTSLTEQVKELKAKPNDLIGGSRRSSRNSDDDDNEFYPFTIRDARRLVPVQIPYGFHVYDYVDVHSTAGQDQESSTNHELFIDGYPAESQPPCQEYSLICYMHKILQVFHLVLQRSPVTVSHFFFMEADNDLCIPLLELESLALRENRYFLGTGIGFSGWIMSRHFLQDFLDEYQFHRKFLEPDVVAATMLMERQAWAVTRQYLVSHTTLPSNGATALTMTQSSSGGDRGGQWSKHLPRCMEPHRGRSSSSSSSSSTSSTGDEIAESGGGGEGGGDIYRDDHGWDFFDYDECPDSDIYPCHERTSRSGVRVSIANQSPPKKKKNESLRAMSVATAES